MKIMPRALVIFMVTLNSCHLNEKKINNMPVAGCQDSVSVNRDTINWNLPKNILDSILLKLELSVDQIKLNTVIDSVFLTPASSFSGDTVYNSSGRYTIAVINYSDGLVCLNKFLLVYQFPSIINTDFVVGETLCDEDESSNYSERTFSILNDTSFLVKELFYVRNPKGKSQVKTTRNLYVINENGKIELVRTY